MKKSLRDIMTLDRSEVHTGRDRDGSEIITEVPKVTDWTVIQSENKVYVESRMLADEIDGFDDAWLEITGNMTVEQKLVLAKHIANKLNQE